MWNCLDTKPQEGQGFIQQFLEKTLWPKMGEMVDLTSKLGKINDIKHNNGSKFYPQIQIF